MVRIIQANKEILSYLERFDSESLTIGLILGQSYSNKDFIVHLAKTTILPPLKLRSVTEINDLWLSDHAKQATRMLSGGMYVIGIFLVSETELLNSIPVQLKTVLTQLNKALSIKYLYGNGYNNEKLMLNYCFKTKSIKCKVFDVSTSNVMPADLKFVEDGLKWVKLECKYDIDEIYHLEDGSNELDLKKQMEHILNDLQNTLNSSLILYDGEFRNDDETIESFGKKKKNLRKVASKFDNKTISVTILNTCNEKLNDIKISNTTKQIHIIGQIMSTVWLNPTISFKMASEDCVQDLIRSLSTRLEMHWDSLIEEEHKEDSNSIHEPPRRVMISVPNSGITVSDYLFPGEGAEEAKTSVEEILDIKFDENSDEIQDVEGSVDISHYGNYIDKLDDGIKEKDKGNNLIFIVGSLFALIVLIFSIFVHLLLKYF